MTGCVTGARQADLLDLPMCAAVPLVADTPLANAAALIGGIAVMQRGVVSFVEKARRAQEAGCVGIVFVNTGEELFTLGGDEGDDDVKLPLVCVRASVGAQLLTALGGDGAAPRASLCYDGWRIGADDDSDEEDPWPPERKRPPPKERPKPVEEAYVEDLSQPKRWCKKCVVVFQSAGKCPGRHAGFMILKKIPGDWEAQMAKAAEAAAVKAKEQAEMGDFDISVFKWCKKCKAVFEGEACAGGHMAFMHAALPKEERAL